VSPRRGDRVTVPPPQGQWDVRFATGDAATGWEELCRHALGNTRRCLETLQTQPRAAGQSGPTAPAARRPGDAPAQRQGPGQWEYEVTSGGRLRYVIDDEARTVWLVYASPRHLKDTDR
jgi:hypothetical protein